MAALNLECGGLPPLCGLKHGATLREGSLGEFLRNSRKAGCRHALEPGQRYSGRSPATTGTHETRMLSGPYGIVVRRGASGRRKREQAPALHRNVAALDLECGASALRLLRLGSATAGAACCAPTGDCYGKARPGVESGSKLPHSTEPLAAKIVVGVAAGDHMFPGKCLVADADRVSVAVGSFVLACGTRTGLSLAVALGIAVALCVAITLGIPVALCVAIPLGVLTSVGARRALRPGLSLRSGGAAYSQQH